MWRNNYQLVEDGRPIATWQGRVWRGGGSIDVTGRRHDVRANAWTTRFEMVDNTGRIIASADRVGRKRWTVQADDRTYQFERVSWWRSDQILVTDGTQVGSVRRLGVWRWGAVADLPDLPQAVQVFVVAVVLAMWQAQAAAAGVTVCIGACATVMASQSAM